MCGFLIAFRAPPSWLSYTESTCHEQRLHERATFLAGRRYSWDDRAHGLYVAFPFAQEAWGPGELCTKLLFTGTGFSPQTAASGDWPGGQTSYLQPISAVRTPPNRVSEGQLSLCQVLCKNNCEPTEMYPWTKALVRPPGSWQTPLSLCTYPCQVLTFHIGVKLLGPLVNT